MAQQAQTELQAARSVLAELAGSEQALADFEVAQKQSPAYWKYMTACYRQAHGAVAAEDTAARDIAGEKARPKGATATGKAIGQAHPTAASQHPARH